MENVQTRLSNAAFRHFEGLPHNLHKRFELHNGELIEMPSPSPLHQWIVARLVFLISKWLEPAALGYVFGDNLDYEPAEGVIVKPDVSFVSRQRAPSLPQTFQIMPDLAVEVVSPSNTEREMLQKVQLYFAHQAQVVWVIYPDQRMVRVYTPAAQGVHVRQLVEGETLEGGALLPDFALPIAEIFPKPEAEPPHEA
ncbi:MAG: Uma2 family endonuclease [Chloroflexi bacterium CFX4]|nr:Uma2 family endonuclease [Chloroflexi bacterium CFX4]MDL1924127.1 Uma2 family endonuclease [Chloroflexi bacterium CFX3]